MRSSMSKCSKELWSYQIHRIADASFPSSLVQLEHGWECVSCTWLVCSALGKDGAGEWREGERGYVGWEQGKRKPAGLGKGDDLEETMCVWGWGRAGMIGWTPCDVSLPLGLPKSSVSFAFRHVFALERINLKNSESCFKVSIGQ